MDKSSHRLKFTLQTQTTFYCETKQKKLSVCRAWDSLSMCFVFPTVLLVGKFKKLFPWVFCVTQKALPHLSSLVWSCPCTVFTPTVFKLQQLVKESQEKRRSANKQFQQLQQCENSPAVDSYTLVNSSEGGGGDPNHCAVWTRYWAPVCLIIAVTSWESLKCDLKS